MIAFKNLIKRAKEFGLIRKHWTLLKKCINDVSCRLLHVDIPVLVSKSKTFINFFVNTGCHHVKDLLRVMVYGDWMVKECQWNPCY